MVSRRASAASLFFRAEFEVQGIPLERQDRPKLPDPFVQGPKGLLHLSFGGEGLGEFHHIFGLRLAQLFQPAPEISNRRLALAELDQHAGATNEALAIARTTLKRLVKHGSRRLQLAAVGQKPGAAKIHAGKARIKLCGPIIVGGGAFPQAMFTLEFAALEVKPRCVIRRRLDLPGGRQDAQVNVAVGAGGLLLEQHQDEHRDHYPPMERAGRPGRLSAPASSNPGASRSELHRSTLIR